MYYIPVYQLRERLNEFISTRSYLLHPMENITAEFALDHLEELDRNSLSHAEVIELVKHARLLRLGQTKHIISALLGGSQS